MIFSGGAVGTVASLGVSVMDRQCFVGGNYSMIGVNDGFIPKPDYFTGLLFKKTMGSKVLTSYQSEPAVLPYQPEMRGYLHCAAPGAAPSGAPGATTFAFANLDAARTFEISFHGSNTDGTKMDTSSSVAYVLTAGDGTLESKTIALNGNILAMGKNNELPPLDGKTVAGSGPFLVPPQSIGFIVFPNAKAEACM